MTNSSFHRASARRRHITSFTSLLEFFLWGSESSLFYFIAIEIVLTSFWIVPQKLKIATEAPYSRFGTRFWVWLIFYSHKLKTRQNGLFWNHGDFGIIWQIWKQTNFSFLKPGQFRAAWYSALHNTETKRFRKSQKMKTDWFRLKIEIVLISALLGNKKSQGSKMPWLILFRLSVVP